MMPQFRERLSANSHVIWLALVTLALSGGWFVLDGHVGINLADEGYLWYGTWAMRHGEVPMRDFQSYDPGRYLWTTAWSYLLGEGLVAMRLACVFFQCLGVLAGLLAARRISRSPLFLGSVAVMLCAWMHPRYKVFEQSIALMSIYAGVLLLEKPGIRRHFGLGVFGGLMAFMGRNHGVYHVAAFGLLIVWASWGEPRTALWQRSAAWLGGIAVGYLPQWLMLLFVPGYSVGFMENLRTILAKGTNLPVNVPWPWLLPDTSTGWTRWSSVSEGCFYLAFPLFLFLALLRVCRLGRGKLAGYPVFLSAACVTLPYTHYVFSRPEIVHLSHGAPELALGLIALAGTITGRMAWLGHAMAPIMAAATLLANYGQFGVTAKLSDSSHSTLRAEIKGERMSLQPYFTKVLAGALRLHNELAKKDEPILFIPNLPGLYPVTERLSPTRQIYFIFPATPEEDRALLAEINASGVQWVMMRDYALDQREELRFRNAYPIVSAHLRENFDLVPIPTLPRDVVVLHRAASR